MAVLLLSYTIYVDTVFALNSVTGQLYYVQVLPDTLEFTLYSMVFTIFGAVTTLAFYLLQVWRPPFRLEYWLVIGYAIILIIPIWGCIGFVDNIDFGFKVFHSSLWISFKTTMVRFLELIFFWPIEPLGILHPESSLQRLQLNRQFRIPRSLLGDGTKRERSRVVWIAGNLVLRHGTSAYSIPHQNPKQYEQLAN